MINALNLSGWLLGTLGIAIGAIAALSGTLPARPVRIAAWGCMAAAQIGWLVASALHGDLVSAAIYGAWTAICIWQMFGGGTGGLKRAAKKLGEKGRAAIARLVRSIKPAPAPQPAGRW